MSPDGAALDALWAAALAKPASALFRTADSGISTPRGQVSVAVRDDGVRHLLVPIDPRHDLKEDVGGDAVTLRRRILEDESSLRTYAALALVDDRFLDLFRALCVEILKSIEIAPEAAVTALRRTLSDWRSLLSGARRTLGPAELAGLFGELLMLSNMIRIDPGAVAYWTGHSGTAQDFHRATISLEVKATTSPEGRKVHIHGIGQLDGGAGRLLLTWVRLRTDRGRSVPDLVDEIRTATDDETAFVRALREAGYLTTDREIYAGRVFEVVEHRTHEIRPGFPRITAAGLTGDAGLAGLAGVTYELDLDSRPAVAAEIDVDPARTFLEHS